MEVHRALGPGFLKVVYQRALEIELKGRGIPYEREVSFPVYYRGVDLGLRHRIDFLCYGDVLLELKALGRLTSLEESRVIHFLLASGVRRAILMNFGARSLEYKRFVGPRYRTKNEPSSVQSVKSVDGVGSVG